MPKIKKYEPDYAALYPDTPIHPDVLKALKQSDRKMKYMEYDLKCERTMRDEAGAIIGILPGREDSYERLLEADKQFVGSAPSPEQVFFEREEIRELQEALAMLGEEDRELIIALYFDRRTEREYALTVGISQTGVSWRKRKILNKLKNFLF